MATGGDIMLPPKNGKPITFKPTPQLREQTEAIADRLNKSLSDYVREAVEHYNTHHQQDSKNEPGEKYGKVNGEDLLTPEFRKTLNEIIAKNETEKQSKMVQQFGKGGK